MIKEALRQKSLELVNLSLSIVTDMRNQLLQAADGKLAIKGRVLTNFLIIEGFKALRVSLYSEGVRVSVEPDRVTMPGIPEVFLELVNMSSANYLRNGSYLSLDADLIAEAERRVA